MSKLIYLAAPYTSHDRSEVLCRVEQINIAAAKLFRLGHFVFSPISHTHPIKEADAALEGHWSFWKDYDERMLSHCDSVVVLMLPGWRESKGVMAEIGIADRLNKRIEYLKPEDLQDL
jgi:nucleoside 2-deoxyribosyltransferase